MWLPDWQWQKDFAHAKGFSSTSTTRALWFDHPTSGILNCHSPTRLSVAVDPPTFPCELTDFSWWVVKCYFTHSFTSRRGQNSSMRLISCDPWQSQERYQFVVQMDKPICSWGSQRTTSERMQDWWNSIPLSINYWRPTPNRGNANCVSLLPPTTQC